MHPLHIAVIVAARPNFVKVGPIVAALGQWAEVEVIHTGQHYDHAMSDSFFEELGIPKPAVNLGVGSAPHGEQTGRTMIALERYLLANPPHAIVVVGDVNSTLAAALVGVKAGIPVAHVEAGLRSGDWSMPEEINRVVVDRVSTWLFAPSEDAVTNLRHEGVEPSRIHLVGNVMIDTLLRLLPVVRSGFPDLSQRLNLPSEYGVLTLHRPSSVDSLTTLQSILDAVGEVSRRAEILFAVHPRTRERIDQLVPGQSSRIRFLEPLGYLDFLGLLDGASLVLTDSGGIQEETSVLGVPCLTLRANTERPITCTLGTNRVVGHSSSAIVAAAHDAFAQQRRAVEIPYWDGKAAERIAAILRAELANIG